MVVVAATRQPIKRGKVTSLMLPSLPPNFPTPSYRQQQPHGEGKRVEPGEVIAPPRPLLIGYGARGWRLAAPRTSPCRYRRHREEPAATPEPGIRVSRGPGSKMLLASSETHEELPFRLFFSFFSSHGFFRAPGTLSHGVVVCHVPSTMGQRRKKTYLPQQELRPAGQQTLRPRLPSLLIGEPVP